jgi:hypothetical protein
MRTAMMAAGIDLTTPGDGHIALDQIQAVGPSFKRPFVIPEIGVVSVPATNDAFEAAHAAVQRVQGGAIRVTPAVSMNAIQYNPLNQFNSTQEEAHAFGYVPAGLSLPATGPTFEQRDGVLTPAEQARIKLRDWQQAGYPRSG